MKNNSIRRYQHQRVIERGRVVSPHVGPAHEGGMDLASLWHALWDGRWIVAVACAVSLAATVLFLLTATPRYQATGLVSIDAPGAPLPGSEVMEPSRSVERELGMLRSSGELARRVLARIDEAALGSEEVAQEDEAQDEPQDPLLRARMLHAQMVFSETPDKLIAITATSPSPEEAARLANLYAETYRELSREERRARLRAARDFLEAQVTQRQTDLQTLEQRWASYVSTQRSTLQGSAEVLASEHASLVGQRQSAQLQLEQERLQQQQIARELGRVGTGLAGALSSDLSTQIAALQERIAELKLEAEEFYTVNPSLRGREGEVRELAEITTSIERLEARKEALAEQLAEQTLTSAVAGTRSGVDYAASLRQQAEASALRVRQLEMQLAGLDGRIDALEDRLSGVPRQQVEVGRIEREQALTEEEYTSFVRQLQLIRVAEQAELGYVTVVREAYLPVAPVWPKPIQSFILSGLFGLFLGGGLALVRAAVRQRLHGPEDLEEHGFRLVGVIPPMEKEAEALAPDGEPVVVEGRPRSPRLLPLLSPWSPVSENYRLIRTNLQASALGRAPRSLLVTSPEVSDGKTLTAVNLAVTMAQGGQRTLLIGADMRRPNAHKLLGLERSPGLGELLEGQAPALAFAPERLATGIEYLHFLPAGRTTTTPPELLGSSRMREVFDGFLAAYDVVIVDAPPVLAATDALLLARLCDATLLVVTAGRTSPSVLEATRDMIEGAGAEVTGTILNRFDGSAIGAGHYGYTYAYAEQE